jgi:WD40 repeat protein
MITFRNENILKLIFMSCGMYDLNHILTTTNNKIIMEVVLLKICYKKLFSSMGKSTTTLKGHNNKIIGVLELMGSCLVSVSSDGVFKIWNLSTNECINTIEDNCIVNSVISLPNGNIVSNSLKGQLKIWKADKDFQCIRTISVEGYDYFTRLIALIDNSLVCSASNKGTPYFVMLDYNKEYEMKSSIKTSMGVGCLAYLYDNKFASSSSGYQIMLWDVHMGFGNYKNLKGHTMWVCSLMFDKKNSLLYSGDCDFFIKIWDCNIDYECIKTVKAHSDHVTCLLLLAKGYFASGSYDDEIKIWDKNNECVNTLSGGKDYLLFLKDYRLVSVIAGEFAIRIYNC